MCGSGIVTSATQCRKRGAFDRNRLRGLGTENSVPWHSFASASLHRDRSLPRGGNTFGDGQGPENQTGKMEDAQSLEASRSHHAAVGITIGQLLQPGSDIAADLLPSCVWKQSRHLLPASWTAGRHGCGALDTFTKDQNITRIFARQIADDFQPRIHFGGQILGGMHRKIGFSSQDRPLKFRRKQPFAAFRLQGPLQALVARRGNRQLFHPRAGMGRFQCGLRHCGLGKGQRRFTRGKDPMVSGMRHRRLSVEETVPGARFRTEASPLRHRRVAGSKDKNDRSGLRSGRKIFYAMKETRGPLVGVRGL